MNLMLLRTSAAIAFGLAGVTAIAQTSVINDVVFDEITGVIGSVTVNGVTFDSIDFVDSSLTDFNDSDQVLGLTPVGAPFPPAASSLVEGFNIFTGLANPDSWQLTFDSPVLNTGGPDVVVVDIGRPDNTDGFTVSTGGSTLDLSGANRPTPYATVFDYTFDIWDSGNTGATVGVPALDSEVFTNRNATPLSQRNFFLLDLSDLGVADGAGVASLDFVGFDGFDVMSVFGIGDLPEPVLPEPGPIQSVDIGPGGVVNSLTLLGTEVPQSQFTNVTMTGFTDPDQAQLIVDGDNGAVPFPASDVLSDFSVNTGVANFGSMTVTFDTPVENTPNGDIVIVDVGFPSDGFDLTINGITVAIEPGAEAFATAEQIPFDVQLSDNLGPFNTVNDLDFSFFSGQNLDAESQRSFVLIELDNFGVTEGATITSLMIENGDPAEFDTVAVFGLPEVVATIIPGDYNGDGYVNAADFTVYRDNLDGSAAAFAFGSRDPSNSGPVNAADHAFWVSQYGNVSAALQNSTSVPEPSTVALAIAVLAPVALRFRR